MAAVAAHVVQSSFSRGNEFKEKNPSTHRNRTPLQIPIEHPILRQKRFSNTDLLPQSKSLMRRTQTFGDANYDGTSVPNQNLFSRISSRRSSMMSRSYQQLNSRVSSSISQWSRESYKDRYRKKNTKKMNVLNRIDELEVNELKTHIRMKVKSNSHEIKCKFINFDPKGNGVVSKQSLHHILSNILGAKFHLNSNDFNKLLSKFNLESKKEISYSQFFDAVLSIEEKNNSGQNSDHFSSRNPVSRSMYQLHSTTSGNNSVSVDEMIEFLKESLRNEELELMNILPNTKGNQTKKVYKAEIYSFLLNNSVSVGLDEYEKLWKILSQGTHKNPLDCNDVRELLENEEFIGRIRSTKNETKSRKEIISSIDNWINDIISDGYQQLRHKFRKLDKKKEGKISRMEFWKILNEFGLPLEANLLDVFFDRCNLLSECKTSIPYEKVLEVFNSRGQYGMVNKIIRENESKEHNKHFKYLENEQKLNLQFVENSLLRLMHHDFLNLMEKFKMNDRQVNGSIRVMQFREIIEDKLGIKFTDEEFEEYLQNVPLTNSGQVKYGDWLSQFDSSLKNSAIGWTETGYNKKQENHLIFPTSKVDSRATPFSNSSTSRSDSQFPTTKHDPGKRTIEEMNRILKYVVKHRFNIVEKEFEEIDDMNDGQMSQEKFYLFLKRLNFDEPFKRNEVEKLWDTFLLKKNKCLDFWEFARHFGYSKKSAHFANSKRNPPQFGDSDFMKRSNKLNSDKEILDIILRNKLDINFEQLRAALHHMDSQKNGFVEQNQLKRIFQEFEVRLNNNDLERLITKFVDPLNNKVNYTEFLRPFARNNTMRYHSLQSENNNESIHSMLTTGKSPHVVAANNQEMSNGKNVTRQTRTNTRGIETYDINSMLSIFKKKLGKHSKELRKTFVNIDVKKTGKIEINDFRNTLMKLNTKKVDADDINCIISFYDPNHRGYINHMKFLKDITK
ncbi:hypothetical protein SNEBB_011040 [Seison nebaliae]|nr:hypothetical protein SNEBB_011040 [Seison nebaliae]